MAIRLGTVAMNGLVLRAASYPGDDWQAPWETAPQEQVKEARPERVRHRRGPVMTAAVVCTMLCSLIARPAYGDPAGPGIPDTGSRPIASGTLVMPGQAGATNTAPPATASTSALRGPFAAQLAAAEATVTSLGQRRLQASLDLEAAQANLTDAELKAQQAIDRVAELRGKADSAAADAYKRAAGLGPLDEYAHDLHQFGMLAPGLGSQPGGQEEARDLLRAEEEQQAAQQAAQQARLAVQDAQSAFSPIDVEFNTKNAEYLTLKSKNDAEVLRIEAEEDAYEQSLAGPSLAASPVIDGMGANPKALQALNFALSKIGSWYVWGDEGPNTFDCSGLAYWAYGQVGVHVPRVANDMYHGTPNIRPTKNQLGDQLLPGDLVFFASDPNDWRSIYHMGIYIGGGRMVHAPTTGERVKIGPVKWSRLFGASRIFPAVGAHGSTTLPPAGNPNPNPNPNPTTSAPPAGNPTSQPPSEQPTSEPPSEQPTSEPPSEEPPSQPPSDPPAEESAPPPASHEPEPSSDPPSSSGASTQAQTSASASGS